MNRTAATLILFLTSLFSMQVCASSDEVLVRQHFPQELVEAGADRDLPTSFEYLVLDAGEQHRRIVAAYSNYVEAAVRIIDVQSDGQAVAGPVTTSLLLRGRSLKLSTVDLNNDGSAEVLLRTNLERCGFGSWFFRVSGNELVILNPTSGGDRYAFCDPDIVDLDGDGRMELLEWRRSVVPNPSQDAEEDALGSYNILRLSDNGLEAGELLALFRYFTKESDENAVEFAAREPTGATMVVVNGAGSTVKASTARIRLNGQVVVGPSDLNQNVSRIEAPVTLLKENRLEVTVGSAPKATILVYFKLATQ
ncbi:MAG: FG-GAP repeat domain-containing protein [Thermoanaerobaculia bacterium]